LQHHGLTEQIPQVVTTSTPSKVVTPSMREKQPRKSKIKQAWEIAWIRYDFINVQRKHFFGIEEIWLDEYSQVSITDKERTLLDVFYLSEDVWRHRGSTWDIRKCITQY
jgi:predicted transcriptional regulator of viral defense system